MDILHQQRDQSMCILERNHKVRHGYSFFYAYLLLVVLLDVVYCLLLSSCLQTAKRQTARETDIE